MTVVQLNDFAIGNADIAHKIRTNDGFGLFLNRGFNIYETMCK